MAKPRVIISTDIGGSDPDDDQSMVHALLYADKLDIKALISTPTKYAGRAADIHQVIDKYSQDYSKLKTWSGEYPTPEYLKSVVYQGNVNVAPSAGWSTPTAGSNAIVNQAKAAQAAGETLWVLTWGAMTDLAQALHDAPSIKSAIKVYSIGAWNDQQDPAARNYIYNSHKDLWWIENDSTFRGMYVNSSGQESNSWNMADARGHGALGDYFYSVRPWGLKMGDTPSLLYLLDGADNNNPSASSWGGSFVKTGHGPNYWHDNPNPALNDGGYAGSETVRIHQQAFYNDFKVRLDRAKSSNPNANVDDPVAANNDTVSSLIDAPVTIKVLANDTAPDGGLQVASFDAASANGGTIAKNTDGSLTYKPASGFAGSDTFKYVARDTDGDLNDAIVTVNVSAAPPPPPAGGTGNPVVAVDDPYKVATGTDLWVNTRYLLMNDKGADGGLKITEVLTKSLFGFNVSFNSSNGTVHYDVASGWNGTDRIDYTLKDADGSADTGSIVVTVGTGVNTTPPPSGGTTTPPPSGGTGNPVVAVDDTSYKPTAGSSFYFNTKYLTWNDKGADGGLKVIALDKVSAKGVSVSWASDGTAIYKAPTSFKGTTDRLNYTLSDADGSTDVGQVVLNLI